MDLDKIALYRQARQQRKEAESKAVEAGQKTSNAKIAMYRQARTERVGADVVAQNQKKQAEYKQRKALGEFSAQEPAVRTLEGLAHQDALNRLQQGRNEQEKKLSSFRRDRTVDAAQRYAHMGVQERLSQGKGDFEATDEKMRDPIYRNIYGGVTTDTARDVLEAADAHLPQALKKTWRYEALDAADEALAQRREYLSGFESSEAYAQQMKEQAEKSRAAEEDAAQKLMYSRANENINLPTPLKDIDVGGGRTMSDYELEQELRRMEAERPFFASPEQEQAYNERYEALDELLRGARRDYYNAQQRELERVAYGGQADAYEQQYYEEIPHFDDFYTQQDDPYEPLTDEETIRRMNGIGGAFTARDQMMRVMKDEELAIMTYLRNTQGEAAADAYFEHLQPQLQTRLNENWARWGAEHPVIGSAVSVAQGMGNAVKGTVYIAGNAIGKAFGENEEIDPYHEAFQLGWARDATREGVVKDMGAVGRFLYQTGMSVADSTAQAALLGGTGGAAMLAGGAMTDTVRSVKLSGGSDEQAMTMGIIVGGAELLTEKMGFDRLGELIGGNKGNVVREILGHMASEFGEEAATEIVGIVADGFVMADRSEHQQLIRQYVQEGMSEQAARKKALLETLGQVGLAGLGGALSGAAMGGGSAALGKAFDAMAQRENARTQAQEASQRDLEAARHVAEMIERNEATEVTEVTEAPRGAETRGAAEESAETREPYTEEATARPQGETYRRAAAATAVSEPTADEMRVREIAAQYGEDARVFEAHYEGGDAETYRRGFSALYTAGKLGLDIGQVMRSASESVKGMSEAQRLGIWQAGANSVKTRINAGVIKQYTKKLNHTQRSQIRILEELGKKYNLEFDVVDSVRNDVQGAYRPGGRRIVVALDAMENAYVQAGAHEMVHYVRSMDESAYRVLEETVLEHLRSSKGFDLEAEIGKRLEQYRSAGQEANRADALEEIVAEAVPTVFSDEQSVRYLVKQNRSLAEKLRDFIVEFVGKLKEIVQRYAAGQGREEIKALLGNTDALAEIATVFDVALEAVADVETVDSALVKAVENDQPIDGEDEIKWSLARNEELQEKAEELNKRTGNVDADVMAQAKDARSEIKAFMVENGEIMHLPADIEGNTFFKDAAYGGSEESTSVCIRSMAVQALMDAVAKDLGRPLTVEDTLVISQDVAGYTDKPECYYCYVAQDRRAIRDYLSQYMSKREDVLAEMQRNGRAAAVDKWLEGKDSNPTIEERFDMWEDIRAAGQPLIEVKDLASIEALEGEVAELQKRIAEGIGGKITFAGIGFKRNGRKTAPFASVLKTASPELAADIYRYIQLADAIRYAQSASWAKKMVGYAAYNGHILRWSPARINDFNNHYGLRMYSFSDFSPAFILENMQMITDAAVKGLKVLAYTKEMEFAEIFAGTGANINISVFATEVNGQITSDGMMGADWNRAQKLRENYPNVGITFVATSDALAAWAEQQDWIDTIIPYHLVRTGKKVAQYFGYKNYTEESSDKKKKGVVFKKGDVTSIPPQMHDNDIVKYVRALERYNLTPRFEGRMQGYNEFIAGEITEDEFRAMNPYYMKYVNETRRSASETKPVQPIFDVDAAIDAMQQMIKEGGYGAPIGKSYEVMQEIAEEIADKIRGGASKEAADKIMAAAEAEEAAKRKTKFSLSADEAGRKVESGEVVPEDVDVDDASIRQLAEDAMKHKIGERLSEKLEPKIGNAAAKIIRDTESQYGKAKLAQSIRGMIARYADGTADEEAFRQLAREIIDKSTKMDVSHREGYEDTRRRLREGGISLTEAQKQAAAERFGSYSDFRRSLFGNVKISDGAMSLDRVWQELSEAHPEMFPVDTGEAEMLDKLVEFTELMQPRYVNPNGMDTEAAAQELALRLEGDVVGLLGAKNIAQKKYASAKKIREQHLKEFEAQLEEQRQERLVEFWQIAEDLKKAKKSGDSKEQQKIMQRYRTANRKAGLHEAYKEVQAIRKAADAVRKDRLERNQERRQALERIEKQANALMRLMAKPNKGRMVPTVLQDTVLKVLESLDFNSEYSAMRGQETQKAKQFRYNLEMLRSFYEDIWNKQSAGETLDVLDGLMMTLSERNVGDIREAVKSLLGQGDMLYLKTMSMRELQFVEGLLNTVKHTAESLGRLWRVQRYQSVVELGDASIEEMGAGKRRFTSDQLAGKVRDFAALDMLEPVSFGERLGDGGKAIIQGLLDGEKEKFAKIREATEATERMMKEVGISGYDIGKWKKHVHTVRLDSGRVVKMTDTQIMNLYLAAKRPQGLRHLLGGGMTLPEQKGVGKIQSDLRLTEGDIERMGNLLSDKQRDMAQRMQKFLAKDAAKWGNDVTQRLYLYDAFNEAEYWTISSDPSAVKTSEPEGERAFNAIINAGFTKPTDARANNAIVIGDAFDVFSRHIGEMASYAGYAEVLTDTMAWLNYKQRSDDGLIKTSVKAKLKELLGDGGVKYLTNLVQDINQARRGGDNLQITNALLGNAKKAAVMGKIRVAIQQPTSIVRAAAEINPIYLLRGLKPSKGAVKEMQKWSALAWWKAHGNYDTGIGQSMDEMLWGDMSRLKTAGDIAVRVGTLGLDPGKLDDMTWAAMWNAVKREISRTHGDLEYGSDEYFKAVAARFEYIMDRTQVVDTVMHRSQIMRGKDGLVKDLTSFMSEPTKSYNMVMRAVMDMGRDPKNPKKYAKLVRTVGVYALSAAATAAATALYDAFKYRDDEDDIWTYLTQGGFKEDYLQQWLKGFMSNVNPLENMVLVGDVYDMMTGGEAPKYMALESIADMVSAVEVLHNYLVKGNTGKRTVYGAIKPIAQAVSNATGVPISGLLANAEMLGRVYEPKWMQTKSEMYSTSRTYEVLYEAIIGGDSTKEQRIRAQLRSGMYGNAPKSDKEVSQGLSDVLAMSDERILEAYAMRKSGNRTKELVAMRRAIQADGFTEDEVNRAINTVDDKYQAMYRSLLDEGKTEDAAALRAKGEKYGIKFEEPKPKNLDAQLDAKSYEYDHLYAVIRNGSVEDIGIVAEIMESESDAKDPAAAIRSAVSEEFRDEYVDYVINGQSYRAQKLARALDVVGIDAEDRERWVKNRRYDDLETAIDRGNSQSAQVTVRALRSAGYDDDSIASSVSSRYKNEYVELVNSGQTRQARQLAAMLQGLGLKTSTGKNKFRQDVLDGWVEKGK